MLSVVSRGGGEEKKDTGVREQRGKKSWSRIIMGKAFNFNFGL